jgi:hypothetical protein
MTDERKTTDHLPNEAELEALWQEHAPRLRRLSDDSQVLDALEALFAEEDSAELALLKFARKMCADDLQAVYHSLLRVWWRWWLLKAQSLSAIPVAYCLARYLEEVRGFDLVDPDAPIVPSSDASH